MTRDPRIDPQPGDVIRVGGPEAWSFRIVTGTTNGWIAYSFTIFSDPLPPCPGSGGMNVLEWRALSVGATVLHPSGATYEGSPALTPASPEAP